MDIATKKILNSILFFANKVPSKKIDRLKLMKLLWLSDRIHLLKYGRLILKDTYCALPNGPVPSKAMDYSKNSLPDYFNVDMYFINASIEYNPDYFSKSDVQVMDFVWDNFGKLQPFDLVSLSHNFPEWIRYQQELSNEFMPKSYEMVIDDFFSIPENDFFKGFISKEDIEDSRMIYHAHNSIQSKLNSECQ